jgi:hypothetical protein
MTLESWLTARSRSRASCGPSAGPMRSPPQRPRRRVLSAIAGGTTDLFSRDSGMQRGSFSCCCSSGSSSVARGHLQCRVLELSRGSHVFPLVQKKGLNARPAWRWDVHAHVTGQVLLLGRVAASGPLDLTGATTTLVLRDKYGSRSIQAAGSSPVLDARLGKLRHSRQPRSSLPPSVPTWGGGAWLMLPPRSRSWPTRDGDQWFVG